MVDQAGRSVCVDLSPAHRALFQSDAPTAPSHGSQKGSEGSPEFSLVQSNSSKTITLEKMYSKSLEFLLYSEYKVILTQKSCQLKLHCTAPLDDQREPISREGTDAVDVPQLFSDPVGAIKRQVSKGH